MLHVLIGTVVGAVVGGAASAVTSLVRGKPISWKWVAAGAAGGAVFGAIATATLGVGVVAGSTALKAGSLAVAGATAGATDQVTHDVLHDESWHRDVGKHAALGGALGCAGGVLAKPAGALTRSLAPIAGRAGGALCSGGRRAGSALIRAPGVAWRGAGQLGKRAWSRYLHHLDTRPILTKALTAGTLGGVGDIAAQKIQGAESIDWKRTAFMAGWGAAIGAPAGHLVVLKLNTWIPGRTFLPIVGKLALDRMVWMPVNASLMIGSKALYDGKTPAQAVASVRRDLIPAWKAGVLFWSSVHGVNFRFIPQNLQVPFGNAAGLVWGTIFSAMINGDEEQPAADTGADSEDGLPLVLQSAHTPSRGGELAVVSPVPVEAVLQPAPEGTGLVDSLQGLQRLRAQPR